MIDLGSLLRDAAPTNRPVKILAVLKEGKPEENTLNELKNLGLGIKRIIHNKIIGSINEDLLPALKKHPRVAEVEVSQTLSPH